MKNDYNDNLIIRVTEYGLKHPRFTLRDLQMDLKLNGDEHSFVENALTEKKRTFTDNPNHILVPVEGYTHSPVQVGTIVRNPDTKYSLLPNAFYNYVDFIEIREARKQANDAKKQSMIAIWISVIAIIVSVVVEFLIFFLQ
jgi:hypothetical protein